MSDPTALSVRQDGNAVVAWSELRCPNRFRFTSQKKVVIRHDLTDITMVIDRSGSMHTIRSEAEGGINAFIQQQKQEQEAGKPS